ncbi:MAG: nucleotidyltransferase family protein [Candidatus Omnitrophica bacterium]|nr:nucleotidyltransferase family protein [Candidatus Omnitrophota bacterium]
MKALILAAGYGTRLYPLTLNRPKPLLKVGSKTITDRLAEKLEKAHEIDEIFIVTNEKFTPNFEEWAEKSSYKKPIYIINDRTLTNETRLGAIGDIDLVIREKSVKDDLLILGGDNLFEFNLSDFILFFRSKKGAALALRDVGDLNEAKKYGVVDIDENEKVLEFAEKPKKPKSTLAAMCLYLFPKDTLHLVKRYLASGGNKDAPGYYLSWLSENIPVYGYKVKGEWFDIGDKRLLKLADELYSKKEKEKNG